LARAGDDGSPDRLVLDVADVEAEVKPVQLDAAIGVIQGWPVVHTGVVALTQTGGTTVCAQLVAPPMP